MIGSGTHAGRSRRSVGLVLVIGAMVDAVHPRRARRRADRRKLEQTLLALYARRPGRRGAVRGAVGPLGVRVQPAARAQLAEAVDGPRRAVAGGRGSRRPGRSCSSSWRTPRWRARRGWSWAGSAARCCRASGWPPTLVAAFSFAYVASERDKKLDLAYFRTSRPGEVTRRIVRNLDQPIEVAVFFPSANEVRDEVDDYLNDLAKESEPAQDHALRLRHRSDEGEGVRRHHQRHPGVLARRQEGAARPAEGDGGREVGAQDAGQGSPAAPADDRQAPAHGGLHPRPRRAHLGARRDRHRQARRHRAAARRPHRSELRRPLGQPRGRPDERGAEGDHRCWRSSGRARRSSPRSTRRSTASSTAAAAC